MSTAIYQIRRLFPDPFVADRRTGPISIVAAILIACMAYFSIELTRSGGRIAAIWLPNAFAVAFLLRSRRRGEGILLIAMFVGNLAANLLHGDSLIKAPLLSASNSLEIVLAVGLARHFVGRHPDMRRISDLKAFLLTSALMAPLASAALATLSLSLEEPVTLASFVTWALSDGLALAIVTPCVLIVSDTFRERRIPSRAEIAHWVVVSLFCAATTVLVFIQTSLPLLFLVPPVVVVSAFRLGSFGTALSTIIVAIVATTFTGLGKGPINLLDYSLQTEVLVLEAFLASAFLMGLPIAAILNAKREMVADLAKREAQLKRARNHAEQAARAKAQFLANMSHEIRTPMNGVLGFAELLQQADLPREQARQVDIIAHSGRSMMAILNDILDISKIEAGELLIEEKPFDPVLLVQECASLHHSEAEKKGLKLDAQIGPEMPPAIIGDPLRLRQILLNLLGNAVKFTQSGGIRITLDRGKGEIRLAVTDTGIGIDANRLDGIFNAFEQAESDTSRRFGGTGLGLSISRQLANLLGGSLTATSIAGEGSRFILTLPLRESQTEIVERRAHRVVEALKFPGSARVLLAEDHDINRMLVSAMLARCNLSVDIAVDGEEAIRKVAGAASGPRAYDLVLMDIQMPGCDGYEATRRIRQAGVTEDVLPIVALTANVFADDVAAAKIAGMQAHLAKPLVFEDVVATLNRWLPHRIVGEDADAEIANAVPARPSAHRMWRERREEAIEAARRALECRYLSEAESEELARTMHKLAGTAGCFGEAKLGKIASTLERALRSGLPETDRNALVQRLLETAAPQKETAAP